MHPRYTHVAFARESMTTTRAAFSGPTHSVGVLARARGATRMQFAALGMLSGTWGAHIPSVKAHYALGEAVLSMVLLAAAIGAVLSLFIAGRVVGRLGARNTAAVAAVVMSLLLAATLEYPGLGLLLPSMLVFGAAMSLFDVSINTEGSELESVGGRAIMSNLHGMFSVGGMAGAALAAFLLGAGVAPRLQLFGVCAVLALTALVTSRGMLETHAAAASGNGHDKKAHFAWPRGLLLIIGLLIFAGMTAEGVMYDCRDAAGAGGDRLRRLFRRDGAVAFWRRLRALALRRALAGARWRHDVGGGDGRRAAVGHRLGGVHRLCHRRCGARAGGSNPVQRRHAGARCQPRGGDCVGHVDRLQRLHDRPAADRRDRASDVVDGGAGCAGAGVGAAGGWRALRARESLSLRSAWLIESSATHTVTLHCGS